MTAGVLFLLTLVVAAGIDKIVDAITKAGGCS